MGRGNTEGLAVPGRRVRRVTQSVAALLLVLMAADASAQCAMCRRALASPEGQQMIAAFRSGILILLAAPFAAFVVVARLAVRMDRARRQSVEREG